MKAWFFILGLILVVGKSMATTYTVTNILNSGVGSLRMAISDANSKKGTDTIVFNLSGTPPHTIFLNAALPNITESLLIEGGNESKVKVSLNGSYGIYYGLVVAAPAVTIRGLEIRNFGYSGVYIQNKANNFNLKSCVIRGNRNSGIIVQEVDGGWIQDCVIGTSENALVCDDNALDGIQVQNSQHLQILDNLISCNNRFAINLENCQYVLVQTNQIGSLESQCLGKATYGIELKKGTQQCVIAKNKISGVQYDGILVEGNTSVFNKISQNELFCNANQGRNKGFRLNASGNDEYAAPILIEANATQILGTAHAQDTIEVFQVRESSDCHSVDLSQGSIYLGTTVANQAGFWSLKGSFCGYVTANARAANNNTSEFAFPLYTGVLPPLDTECGFIFKPLFIQNFKAQLSNKDITLQWESSPAITPTVFRIEWFNPAHVWQMASFVPTQTYQTSYTCTTKDYREGLNFYRLSYLSPQGKQYIYRTLAVEVGKTTFIKDNICLEANLDYEVEIKGFNEEADIKVVNKLGQVEQVPFVVEPYKIRLNTKKLPTGMYQVHVSTLNQSYGYRFVIYP